MIKIPPAIHRNPFTMHRLLSPVEASTPDGVLVVLVAAELVREEELVRAVLDVDVVDTAKPVAGEVGVVTSAGEPFPATKVDRVSIEVEAVAELEVVLWMLSTRLVSSAPGWPSHPCAVRQHPYSPSVPRKQYGYEGSRQTV